MSTSNSYIGVDEFLRGTRAVMFQQLDVTVVREYLENAAIEMDGYLATPFSLPLRKWGADIKRINAQLATYALKIEQCGMRPDSKEYEMIRAGYEDAVSALNKIQLRRVAPRVEDSTSNKQEYLLNVVTSKPSGW